MTGIMILALALGPAALLHMVIHQRYPWPGFSFFPYMLLCLFLLNEPRFAKKLPSSYLRKNCACCGSHLSAKHIGKCTNSYHGLS